MAKIVDKTKDVVSSALETIDHLENGRGWSSRGGKGRQKKREAPEEEEETQQIRMICLRWKKFQPLVHRNV